jgi:hypothetical protein
MPGSWKTFPGFWKSRTVKSVKAASVIVQFWMLLEMAFI